MPKAYGFTQYGGPEVEEMLDVEVPTPGPGEILVAVRAAGVNPADVKIREGAMAEQMAVDFPAVFGREVSGVVQAMGQDVTGFAEHDEVFGAVGMSSGGYAEFALLAAATAAKKPVKVSHTDAATLSVAASTAWDGIQQLNLAEGGTLLINGIGGGVGVIAAQLARDAGVFVIGTASESKRELVESLGATLVTYGDGVADRVRALLPDGVDAVFDLVGGQALRDVAPLAKDPTAVVTAVDPVTIGEVGGQWIERTGGSAALDALAELVADGKLDPHVSDVVPLDRAGEALASVASGHIRGKVVIEVV